MMVPGNSTFARHVAKSQPMFPSCGKPLETSEQSDSEIYDPFDGKQQPKEREQNSTLDRGR